MIDRYDSDYYAGKPISERAAAFATKAWIDAQAAKFLSDWQSDEMQAVLDDVIAKDSDFLKRLMACAFNYQLGNRNELVELARPALFEHYKNVIDAQYQYRFDWPTYEYVANPSEIDEE